MWVFDEYGGFYSAVVDSTDSDVLWVRTRDFDTATFYSHMVNEHRVAEYGDDAEYSGVLEWEGRDYAYRVKSNKDEWARYLSYLVETSEATNFKDKVSENAGNDFIVPVLSKIWQIMYNYQENSRE